MSLILWLPLQGTLENKGISDIVVDGHSSTVDTTNGKLALSCQKFARSTSQYLSFPAFLSTNSEFTYCCWFKTSSLDQTQCLFSQRTAAAATGFSIFYMGASNDTIRFDDGASLSSNGTISTANQWYHIAIVRTTTNKYIYINGALSGSGTKNTPTKVNTNYAVIGGSQGNATAVPTDNALNGYLQDVRIYDHALSAAEIKELARGLMVHYKLNDGASDHENLLKYTLTPSTTAAKRVRLPNQAANTGGRGTCTVAEHGLRFTCTSANYAYIYFGSSTNGSGTLHGLTTGETYTFSADVSWKLFSGATTNATTWYMRAILALDLGSGKYSQASQSYNIAPITQADKGTEMSGRCEFTFTIPTNCIRFYLGLRGSNTTAANYASGDYIEMRNVKLEHSDHATPYEPSRFDLNTTDDTTVFIDSSGYENHANVIGNITKIENTKARYATCAEIKDNASNLTSSRLIQTSDNKFSFNIWYNPSEYVNSAMVFRHKLNSTLGFNFGCTGSSDSLSHQFLVFRIGTNYVGFKDFEFPLNEWHMWTGTYDGTTAKLYKDGVLLGTSGSATGYTAAFSDGNTFLGSITPVSLKAYASDIRMYATVLDADYIKELYETSMKIDNLGNVQPFEIVEEDTSKLLKNGQLKTIEIIEYNNNAKLTNDGTWYANEFIER